MAEVVGTGTAVIAAYVAYKNGGDALYSAPTALAASTGETVGFYATSLGLEYRKRRKDDPSLSRTQALGNAATSEVKTYGPAEGVDFVTRPLAMWAAANIGLPGGVISETVAGKLIGDVPFFMSANHFLNAQERLTAVGAKPTFKNMLIDDKNRIASALTTKRSGRHAK